MRWQVLVPQKPLATAKSRLRDASAAPLLAEAMLRDVVAACTGPDRDVWLVGGDPALPPLGTGRLPDAGGGLSAAVAAAAAGLDGPVAVVMADLPCLRAGDVTAVLALAAAVPVGAVADAAGTGTTLLAARDPRALLPSYGEGSFARHLATGAVDLLAAAPDLPRLRRDVDTVDDLRAALALGVGPATARAVATTAYAAVHLHGE